MLRVNEYGRSMIEMLGVLAIVGVLSVGGISGYSKAMNKFKANKVVEQVSMISSNVQTLFATSRDYKGLNLEVAVVVDIIPEDMINGVNVINAFGGGVDVFASKLDNNENGAFIVAFSGIPASECINFGANNIIGDNVIAFSYGLRGSDDDDDDGEDSGGCNLSGFDLNEITESSDPVSGSCCLFRRPGHNGCDYPSSVAGTASISFGATCTVAWKIK